MTDATQSVWRRFTARLKSSLLRSDSDVVPTPPSRKPRTHVLIIDGTQSRLGEDEETNAGLLYKLLKEAHNPEDGSLWYHPGIQGHGFWNWVTIASGWGINQAIFDGYAQLAEKYNAGDKIYLFGFSRGAYAVRSISGMIGTVGLLRCHNATNEKLRFAFRLYESQSNPAARSTFKSIHCHDNPSIEMIGVWDTVKALGLPYPILTYLAPMATEFHSTNISDPVQSGYQALALDEDRTAYRPVIWDVEPGWKGHLEQVWFKGAHADIGGHVWKTPKSRPLSNIPLIWMGENAEKHGLKLPLGWQSRFPTDANAPAVGSRSGIGKFFLLRTPRVQGEKPFEYMHSSTGSATPLSATHADAPATNT
ncbi:MAG: DUF2235 domain-containing protein [Amylibacter sp.]|jgi:uncharacterized protein (DUF2235 family)|nr:DUF2235 domain-containing protein [Amylibacter sp.]